MENCRYGMQTGNPNDRIAQPRVDARDARAGVMRKRQRGWYFQPTEQRQRMSLEPCSGDCGKRDGEKKNVERPMRDSREDAHPARYLWLRPGVDRPPHDPQRDKGEDGESQRLMQLSVEVASSRIDALLGAAR